MEPLIRLILKLIRLSALITATLITSVLASLVPDTPPDLTPYSTPEPAPTLIYSTPEPAPTQEIGTPVPTPATPPPHEKKCVIKTGSFVILERADHATTAAYRDRILPGSVVTLEEAWQGTPYLWARSATGWFAIREGSNWWIYGLEGSEFCPEIPGWPAGLAPPVEIVASPLSGETLDGMHFAWFTDPTHLAETAPLIGMAKCLTLTGSHCDQLKNANTSLITVYRDVRSECPSREQVYSDSAGYYARLRALWADAPGFDYYEIMNECGGFAGAEDFAALAQFHIEIGLLAARDGYCILALSPYPGSPEISEFNELEPYFRFADRIPCGRWPNGALKYHGLATHSTGYCPPEVDTSRFPWVGWVWVAGRHLLYSEAIGQARGYSIPARRWPWLITELGWTYGQSEDSAAFTLEELRACNRATVETLSDQNLIDGYMIWNFGGAGWLDYTPLLPDLFQ